MALFSVRDLTHWAAWGDFLLIWKHKYSLPAKGNFFVLCNSTGTIVSVVFNGVKKVVVDVSWTLWFYLRGVAREWMSSVFEVLFLFWFLVMSLLSSWNDMDVPVELLTGDAWAAEDDKAGFLNVGMDCFGRLHL